MLFSSQIVSFKNFFTDLRRIIKTNGEKKNMCSKNMIFFLTYYLVKAANQNVLIDGGSNDYRGRS